MGKRLTYLIYVAVLVAAVLSAAFAATHWPVLLGQIDCVKTHVSMCDDAYSDYMERNFLFAFQNTRLVIFALVVLYLVFAGVSAVILGIRNLFR